MSRLRSRSLLACLVVGVLSGCVGGDANDAPLDAAAMDAALNDVGERVTNGEFRAFSTEECPVVAGDDLLDAFVEAGALDRADVDEAASEIIGTVIGPWGRYSVECRHRLFDVEIRNGGPEDRDELVAFVEASTTIENSEITPAVVDGLDESQTYEFRVDGELRHVGWIADEVDVAVSIRNENEPVDFEASATALVTVLGLLDEQYADTETVERPVEPPVDLDAIRAGLQSLGGDVESLPQGEQFDTCPLLDIGDVADFAERVGVDAADLEQRGGFIAGTNPITDVTVQCGFEADGASLSINAALVDFDGLDEFVRVTESAANESTDRSVDVDARADGLPDDAVYSTRTGDNVVGVGVLSGEVAVQVTVARVVVDDEALLAQLSTLVDTVSDTLR